MQTPIHDPNSVFATVAPADTPRVMEALRKKRVRFSVSNNPEPQADESGEDIFWFFPTDDIPRIQATIREVISKKA
ncbi:hypothetical protein [Opitutus sp. GAS368]|jgi:hypothetical protein|uniref:hypothetical protein n=1 Tax=Opitutus sp. GAS368 TaxID=1882749 RepID=UPI0012FE1C78|nr:hypothetical protein [Opitutus sp. GAS368]